jgi:hypothetical protein
MKKFHFMLPLLAFIMAVGMSFAVVENTAEDFYATGYIQIGTTWYAVDVDCQQQEQFNCLAQIQGQSTEYPVHTAPSLSSPLLKSNSPEAKVIPDPRP